MPERSARGGKMERFIKLAATVPGIKAQADAGDLIPGGLYVRVNGLVKRDNYAVAIMRPTGKLLVVDVSAHIVEPSGADGVTRDVAVTEMAAVQDETREAELRAAADLETDPTEKADLLTNADRKALTRIMRRRLNTFHTAASLLSTGEFVEKVF